VFVIKIINNGNSKIVILRDRASLIEGTEETAIPEDRIIVILSAVAAAIKKKKQSSLMPTNEEIAVIKAAIRHYCATKQVRITVRPPVTSMWKIAARLRI